MKRHILYLLGALFVVVPVSGWAYLARPPAQAAPVISTPIDPTAALNEISLRTGDEFWGLHLDGVIPCSTMLVKGGGHLVILSPMSNPTSKCHFHVKDEKVVKLAGRTFRMKVVDEDCVQVVREEATLAANTH